MGVKFWSTSFAAPEPSLLNLLVDYGRCGAFAVCNVVDATPCRCVRGFTPRSAVEWYMRNTSGGCGGGDGGGDGFYLLRGVKLPDTHSCVVDAGATLEQCARRCLANCSCTAYSAVDIRGGGSGCIQWFDDLMDTRFVDGGRTSMLGLHCLN
ncbi:S-locus-specific glycoprotein-like [Miscanthus floridulus]|uniref:S-locus-specific glycoprotein-like n=1 Tax=Miscanthus floridulus TaxID=154761 RepID=UPI003459934D